MLSLLIRQNLNDNETGVKQTTHWDQNILHRDVYTGVNEASLYKSFVPTHKSRARASGRRLNANV